MTTQPKIINYLTRLSLWSLSISLFVSHSANALHHLFILVPICYFFFKTYIVEFEIKKIFSSLSIDSKTFLALIIILGGISTILTPLNIDIFKSIFKMKYLLIGLASSVAFKGFFNSLTDTERTKELKNLIVCSLIFATLATASGIIGLKTGFNPLKMKMATEVHRASGMYGMAITYGNGIALYLVLILSILCNTISLPNLKLKLNLKNLIMSFLSVVVIASGLYYSFTRGAALGFLASLPFIFFHKKLFFKISIAISVTALFLALFFTTRHSTVSTKNRFFSNINHQSNLERLSNYKAAIYAIKEKPLLGWGYNNFQYVISDIKVRNNISFPDFQSHAHNNYLEFGADLGIPGFILLLLFTLFWFWEMLKRNDLISKSVIPFIVCFFVTGQFQTTLMDGENAFLIMFVYAISQSLPFLKKTGQPQ